MVTETGSATTVIMATTITTTVITNTAQLL